MVVSRVVGYKDAPCIGTVDRPSGVLGDTRCSVDFRVNLSDVESVIMLLSSLESTIGSLRSELDNAGVKSSTPSHYVG